MAVRASRLTEKAIHKQSLRDRKHTCSQVLFFDEACAAALDSPWAFRGGGHSLLWPIQGCASGQGMVFGLSALNRVYYIVLGVSVLNKIRLHGCRR